MNKKILGLTISALLVGGGVGYALSSAMMSMMMSHDMPAMGASAAQGQGEPLYWVAPMDPSYKRDKPGKSPMGMDLIPVYSDGGGNEIAGTVKINAAVENNLGVKTASVNKEVLSPKIETVGYVAFDESTLWQTNVRVAGWVEKLNIYAVGDKVKGGDVLFTLYSPELVKAQEELISAYQSGRSGLIQGAKDRLLTLGVDNQQIEAVAKSRKVMQSIEIKAPSDGIIASLNIREGGYVSPAQTVISAGPIDNVWVDVEVFERQAHWISAGSLASMTLEAIPGKNWQGKIEYVYPILNSASRTLRVRLVFANPDAELKPNMFANISLLPSSKHQVLTIPLSAVIRTGGMARVVLAEGEGKYRSARIEVGREAADKIEVLSGLNEGDKVVTSAHFLLDSESSQTAELDRINGLNEAMPSMSNMQGMDGMQGMSDMKNMDEMQGMQHNMGDMQSMDEKSTQDEEAL